MEGGGGQWGRILAKKGFLVCSSRLVESNKGKGFSVKLKGKVYQKE